MGELVLDFDPANNTLPGLRFSTKGIQVRSRRVRFDDDEYHHLAATYDNGRVVLYLDGKQVGSGSIPAGPVVLKTNLRLGEDLAKGGADEQLHGFVDDVLVLRRVLTAKEVAAMSQRGTERRVQRRLAKERKAIGKLSAGAKPIDIGSRRELFVDRYLIDQLRGVTLELHHPRHEGIVVKRDFPWEGRSCFGYITVLKDTDRYRMYYRACPKLVGDGTTGEFYCYAESKDGITWTKPDLGLYEVMGTKKNNVVLAYTPPCTHNFAPLIDTRPGVPPSQKYKALGGTSKSGLVAFVSPDAIHWKKLRKKPVIIDKGWVFDSQNVAFWSEAEQCYVCYYRRCPEGMRAIARVTSKDFLTWSKPVQMQFGDAGTRPPEHLYTNQTHPYFRAPHIYIATAARFMPGRGPLTAQQVKKLGLDSFAPWLKQDCSDAVFMTSRGGDRYDRTFMQAFIRPGLGPRNWVSRTTYPAWGVVPTGPTEMSLYVHRHGGQESVHVARFSLRIDGFASVNAPYKGGQVITKPLTFAGKELEINFSTSAAGSIRVGLLAPDGTPIRGYTASDCPEIIGDEIARVVRWKGGSDLSALAGKPVRLRFVLKDADLYSFRFRP